MYRYVHHIIIIMLPTVQYQYKLYCTTEEVFVHSYVLHGRWTNSQERRMHVLLEPEKNIIAQVVNFFIIINEILLLLCLLLHRYNILG